MTVETVGTNKTAYIAKNLEQDGEQAKELYKGRLHGSNKTSRTTK